MKSPFVESARALTRVTLQPILNLTSIQRGPAISRIFTRQLTDLVRGFEKNVIAIARSLNSDQPTQRICQFFSSKPTSELGGQLGLVLAYSLLKLSPHKRGSASTSHFKKSAVMLKLATLGGASSMQNNERLPVSRGSDLKLYQSLNDYFFSPAFYFNINKNSR